MNEKSRTVDWLLLGALVCCGPLGCGDGGSDDDDATGTATGALTLQMSGAVNDTLNLDTIQCSAFDVGGTRAIAVLFMETETAWPHMQANVRNVEENTGTFVGGDGGDGSPSADLDVSVSGTVSYTTYNTFNFNITIDSFSQETGVSGHMKVADGGVLSTFDGSSTITLSPSEWDYSCPCVNDMMAEVPNESCTASSF